MSEQRHHGGPAKVGISELAIAIYELTDGLKFLAEKEPANVQPSDLADLHGVGRSQGEWRMQARCPRCGAWHVHGAGVGIAPFFGTARTPACGGRRYWLTLPWLAALSPRQCGGNRSPKKECRPQGTGKRNDEYTY